MTKPGKKYGKLMVFMIFGLSVMLCGITIAEDGDENAGQEQEVLTTLEQRMLKKISIDFSETPIDDVIMIIADQADVDIVKSPDVTGAVTAKLTDVPLEEALKNILASHGFGYIVDKNMIRIAPVEEIYASGEKIVSRIYRITYANISEVQRALKGFVSKEGSVSANPGTSNIIVTDTETKIKAIDTFIEEVDRITPQILVEARIYDITNKNSLDLGVEWSAGRNTTYDATGGVGGTGINPTEGNIDPFMTGLFSGTTTNAETTGIIRVGWLNSGIDIDAMLRAEHENLDAKLLANPRILVLDNEKADIKIISEIPYQELTETSAGGSIGTTSFREVGVELEVTPHLTRGEMIRLNLKPKFSIRTGNVEVGVGGPLPQPVVDRREATTTLLIKSGQTVVLGGLRKKEATKQINKIPLLGDLPLIGGLFRFEGEDTVTSELVVFVTPWLIENPELSPTELEQFKITDFDGPKVTLTKAEKEIEK